MHKTEQKYMIGYGAVYIDRGEQLEVGEASIPDQIASIRKFAAVNGQLLGPVGIDVIVGDKDASRLETLVEKTERLLLEAFAGDADSRLLVVVGMVAKSQKDEPRSDGYSARGFGTALLEKGKVELPSGAEERDTENGYAFRIPGSQIVGRISATQP
jgi:hypothetical protein